MKINRRYVLLAILFLIIIVLFLPIKVHYSFHAIAKIYPLKEWSLNRGQDDSYVSEMHNYKFNVLSHVKSYKFERGDVSEVFHQESYASGDLVENGDTLAYINSYYIENELAKLYSLKSVEEENLKMSLAGEKQELIEQAEQEYNFQMQQLELEKKNYTRYQKLFEDSIISTADFEVHENAFRLAEINLEIAGKNLNSMQTGDKEEEIDYIRQRIEGYEREIQSYEKLRDQYFIISPISGIASFNSGLNGLITISDTSEYILKIPVKVNDVQYLDKITGIKFSMPGYSDKLDASFLDIDESVSLLSNEQLVMAKASISGGQLNLIPGMAVQCSVVCDKITLIKYLQRRIKFQF